MNCNHAGTKFWTTTVLDRKDGFAGVRLQKEQDGVTQDAAEVIFWDAVGQYFLETKNGEVPLNIVEALIAEAKAFVGV
jgi:hypothetical protein